MFFSVEWSRVEWPVFLEGTAEYPIVTSTFLSLRVHLAVAPSPVD